MKLIQLHWAYFALYMEIDRGLLVILDRDKPKVRTTLHELQADAEGIFSSYLRVMKARARVDSALAGLGGDEQEVWNLIADVQKFDALVGGVDRKVEVLQKMADRRVQLAKSRTDRRTAIILGFLTSLALVTLVTTLLGYFVGGLSDKPEEHPALRVALVVGGLLLAVVLWLGAFELRLRPKTKERAPGSTTE